MLFCLIYIWNLKQQQIKIKLSSCIQRIDWWLPEAASGWMGKRGESGQREKLPHIKIRKKFLSDIEFTNIFSHSVGCFFSFSIAFFEAQKF